MNYMTFQNPISLFDRARQRGRLQQMKSALFGAPQLLLDLDDLTSRSVYSQRYDGLKPVKIDLICGTQGRRNDFDRYFHPLSDRFRDRWVSVATARQSSIPLAMVRLIRVGECYFVIDGHNRISVARALGESVMDAEIIVWEVHRS